MPFIILLLNFVLCSYLLAGNFDLIIKIVPIMLIIIVVEQLGYSNYKRCRLDGRSESISVDALITSIIIAAQLRGRRQQRLIYPMLPNGKINMREVIQCLINLNIDFFLNRKQILLRQRTVRIQVKILCQKVAVHQ